MTRPAGLISPIGQGPQTRPERFTAGSAWNDNGGLVFTSPVG